MYYKLPFLAGMIVVVLVLYFLITSLTAKDMVLSVMLIDAHTDVSSEKMAEEYMEASGLDTKKYQVQIQNNLMFQGTDSGSYSMTSLSKFMADIGSELLDVCGMTKDDFVKYDGSQTWMDLRDCLTDEQMTVLEDKLLTTDEEERLVLWQMIFRSLRQTIAIPVQIQKQRLELFIIHHTKKKR